MVKTKKIKTVETLWLKPVKSLLCIEGLIFINGAASQTAMVHDKHIDEPDQQQNIFTKWGFANQLLCGKINIDSLSPEQF